VDQDELRDALGGTDIMLVDQLLRGRIGPRARVFDAGCGGGRNLRWFLARDHEVGGCDSDPEAIDGCRRLWRALRGADGAEAALRREPIEANTFADTSWDLVICNAVLHFAPDAGTALAQLGACWDLVAPGGTLFVRLATRIGLPDHVRPPGFTFLPDMAWIRERTVDLGAELRDPVRTSNVENRRCMTTWVLSKPR